MSARLQRECWSEGFCRGSTLAMVFAVIALGIVFVLHGALNADEGFYLLASSLVTEGLRPFRDFGFTQTPLVAYANVPWLALFGYDLTGIRLAGLAWTGIAVVIGVGALRRRHGWAAPMVFALLLAAGPTWLAFATKGKTYAFSSLAILLGTIAVTTKGTSAWRWALFIVSSAVGVGARLPTAAFFLSAGILLLVMTPGWRARTLAVAAVAAAGTITLWLATAGSWENFWFWTTEFHAASTIRPSFGARLLDWLAIAPGLWLVLAVTFSAPLPRADKFALISLLMGVLVNVLPPSGYAEYATLFIPALALVAAHSFSERMAQWHRGTAAGAAVAMLATGWIEPPRFDLAVLQRAAEASDFLATHTAPTDQVVASMPEIAVAARRAVPPALAMGKFALTESLSEADAERRIMLTPAALVGLLEAPSTQAVALSAFKRWNFSWSVPDYHYLADESRTRIFATIQREYELAYTNAEYVIFLRKDDPGGDGTP